MTKEAKENFSKNSPSDTTETKISKNFFFYLFLFVFLAYAICEYYQIFTTQGFHHDFSSYFKSGLRLTQSQNIYTTFPLSYTENGTLKEEFYFYLYPPFIAYIFSKLSFIGEEILVRCFFIFNLLLLPLCAKALKDIALAIKPNIKINLFLLTSLLFIAEPFIKTFYEGQVNIIVLAAMLYAINLCFKKNYILSGICLALAIYIKISPLLLCLVFLRFKQFKVLFYALLSCILITLLISFDNPLHFGVFQDFFQALPTQTTTFEMNLSGVWSFTKELALLCGLNETGLFIAKISILVLAVLITFLLKWQSRRDFIILFAILTCAMIMASPVTWLHHIVWMTLPLFSIFCLEEKKILRNFLTVSLYIFLLIPFINERNTFIFVKFWAVLVLPLYIMLLFYYKYKDSKD